jgi:hypothetical protein
MTADHGDRLPVRLYWSDGRVEDAKDTLDVSAHPRIVRRSGGRHVPFVFTGIIDADGFAVYEEQPESADDR